MSRFHRLGWLSVPLCILAVCLGCGGNGSAPAKPTAAENGSAEEPAGAEVHKSYAASDLPEVGEKLPPADQGRVVIALPVGWKTLQRNPKYLVAIVPEENTANQLPRIAVTVSDAPADLTASTSASNAGEHIKALQAAAEKKKVIEPCKAIALGDNTWIRHVRSAKMPDSSPAAIQSLQTVRSGRLYTIDLTVSAKENPRSSKSPLIYQKSLQDQRNFAYAMGAHMAFPKEGSAAAPEPPPKENGEGEKAKSEANPTTPAGNP